MFDSFPLFTLRMPRNLGQHPPEGSQLSLPWCSSKTYMISTECTFNGKFYLSPSFPVIEIHFEIGTGSLNQMWNANMCCIHPPDHFFGPKFFLLGYSKLHDFLPLLIAQKSRPLHRNSQPGPTQVVACGFADEEWGREVLFITIYETYEYLQGLYMFSNMRVY